MRLYGTLDCNYVDYKEKGTQKYYFFDCIEANWVDDHNGAIKYDKEDWPPQWIVFLSDYQPSLEEDVLCGVAWYEIEIEEVETEEQADATLHSEQNFFRSDVQRDAFIKIVSKNQTDKVGY